MTDTSRGAPCARDGLRRPPPVALVSAERTWRRSRASSSVEGGKVRVADGDCELARDDKVSTSSPRSTICVCDCDWFALEVEDDDAAAWVDDPATETLALRPRERGGLSFVNDQVEGTLDERERRRDPPPSRLTSTEVISGDGGRGA